ncbi:MAG: 4a-hydroxytetrahydrobiopterin dehydratase [Anaerolineae bacterium]|nr:4a-hydroxytetrahydrobiopterin dehydratase [Anaerolineae bacterium]
MSTTMSEAEVQEKLVQHPGWTLGEDGQLHAEFRFKNFAQTLLFVNAVGHLAEAADHHPDLFIHGYKYLKVSLMSHDVGGVTARDFRLIAQIGALPMGQPTEP